MSVDLLSERNPIGAGYFRYCRHKAGLKSKLRRKSRGVQGRIHKAACFRYCTYVEE